MNVRVVYTLMGVLNPSGFTVRTEESIWLSAVSFGKAQGHTQGSFCVRFPLDKKNILKTFKGNSLPLV
jgi:hypothetical protein